MKPKKIDKILIIFLFLLWIFIILLTIKFQNCYSLYGLIDENMINTFMKSIEKDFFNITINKESIKLCIYITAFFSIYVINIFFNKKQYLPGKEHGSSQWSDKKSIKKILDNKNFHNNIILTKTEGISLDCKIPGVNLNVLIIGGSGTGKTRFYLKPNLMQMNSSYVITDPKGEVLNSCGKMLQDNGYKIKVLNLVKMSESDSYNPFYYLKKENDEDVMTLINTLMTNTTGEKSSNSADPFWEKAEMLFLQAIFFYLVYEAPEYEKNIPMVMELIRAADIKEDEDDYESTLDILFNTLEKEKGPGHIAVVQYQHFKVAAGKTAKSIVISAAARLAPYNISSIAQISLNDELNLGNIGEEKTALFVIISPTNTTFNFIAAMMYTQLFAELDYIANWKYGGTLPIKVRFLLDEFANIGKIPNFEKILAYARSLGLGISPIVQSLAQLKEMYEKGWEGIIDNCSSLLFLGGQGQGTLEYISKQLGKATIDIKKYSLTKGKQGSSSKNYDNLGRELMTMTEIREMKFDECILFINGKKPFFSKKFDITKHKNYKLLKDFDKNNVYFHKKENIVSHYSVIKNSESSFEILIDKINISSLFYDESEVKDITLQDIHNWEVLTNETDIDNNIDDENFNFIDDIEDIEESLKYLFDDDVF